MNWGDCSITDFCFHARYHLIMALFLLVTIVVAVQEIIRAKRAESPEGVAGDGHALRAHRHDSTRSGSKDDRAS